MSPDQPAILGACVGNSRTRLGLLGPGGVEDAVSIAHGEADELARRASELIRRGSVQRAVVVSVSRPGEARVLEAIRGALPGGGQLVRVGHDVRVPIALGAVDPSTVGQDRLVNALAAYSRAQRACAVIDAGTAITVDYVDHLGTFQGGAIAAGAAMMLRALHEGTDALPAIALGAEDPSLPFGIDTPSAMRAGVRAAIRGLVRFLVERYAEYAGQYPVVVATGGDSATLFADEPLVEHLVPDLQLLGLAELCRAEGWLPAEAREG